MILVFFPLLPSWFLIDFSCHTKESTYVFLGNRQTSYLKGNSNLSVIDFDCVHSCQGNGKFKLKCTCDMDFFLSESNIHPTWSVPWAWWHHQMEIFSALLSLCAGNSPVTDDFPSQRPVARSFVFFICAWINDWVNNRQDGDLRRHSAHYDVIVMSWCIGDARSQGNNSHAIDIILLKYLNLRNRRLFLKFKHFQTSVCMLVCFNIQIATPPPE